MQIFTSEETTSLVKKNSLLANTELLKKGGK